MSLTLSRRAKRALAVVLIGGSLAGFAFSSAYFSSTDTTDFTTLTAGTIEIDATDSPATWTGAYGNLLPGASANADITVENTGTAGLVYAIAADSATDTVGFDGALSIELFEGTCNTADFDNDTPLFTGDFADVATEDDIVGDSEPYTDAGDRYLAEANAVGDSEDLCVHVTFENSGTTQNALQGATADLTLTFNATQINAAGDNAP